MRKEVNEIVIKGINRGEESSFKILYDACYAWLCSYATSYIIDPDKAEEIVNDVFINIWAKREELQYPVYAYLQHAVKYGCLNHIRFLKSQQTFLDGYKEEIFSFQEQYCLSDETPLQQVEIKELQEQVDRSINSLPEKCRIIFKKYLYEGTSPKDIAAELGINVNTVRVQIKIAFDKIRNELGPLAYLIFFYLLSK